MLKNLAVRDRIFKTFGMQVLPDTGLFSVPEKVDDWLFRLRDVGWHLHSLYAVSAPDRHVIYATLWTEDDNDKAITS